MITIRDNINTLTPHQVQALKDKSNAYPFDVYLTVGAQGSKAAFQAEVSSLVTRPAVLSIGVDPAHHFTFVRGSVDLGLPSGPEVASAGNAFFKRADLVGGVDAITAKALELKVATRVTESATGTPIVVHEHTTSSGVWWGLGAVAAVVLGVAVWNWVTVRRREREHRRAVLELEAETADRQIEKAERADLARFDRELSAAPRPRPTPAYYPPPPVPAPAPVVVNSGNNDLLTGIVIGDMMHRHDTPAPAPVVVREVVRESSPSSWSSDSGSSSSSDWGGGSSDWGGGGGGSDW